MNRISRAWIGALLVSSLAIGGAGTGCAGLSRAQQRALTGGAVGAAGGALIGGAAGSAGTGAAIGGAAGAAGGYLYEKNEERKYYQRRDRGR